MDESYNGTDTFVIPRLWSFRYPVLGSQYELESFLWPCDDSEISTRVGAWMLFAVPRRTIVTQGFENHRISVD